MQTGAVTGNESGTSLGQAVNQKILGKDDFFKLLITELKYQDPLEPMKDREFIAQMASFSSLEQMQNMNKNFESFTNSLTALTDKLMSGSYMQQAISLIGKEVEFAGDDGTLSGRVESVVMENGIPKLVIGEQRVDLSGVLSIRIPPTKVEDTTATDNGTT